MEIEDEIDLHKTGWIAQRIGWAIILLIPVMGLLGLFGTGWLSESTVSENGYRLTYERFGRYEAPSTISLDVNSTSGNELIVAIPLTYADKLEITSILPEPTTQSTANGFVTFHFNAANNSKIVFYVEPEVSGNITGAFTVNGTVLSVSHYIYP